MTDVYLFEIGGKTIIGYVELNEYKREEADETPDMLDCEYVTLTYPAMVNYTMVPTPAKISRAVLPPGQQEMSLSIQTIVSPLAVPDFLVFVDRCFGFAKVEPDSFLTAELKRVSAHFFTAVDGKEGNA